MGASNPVSLLPVPDSDDGRILGSAIAATLAANNSTVIAAVAGKKIFVVGMHISATATNPVQVQDVGTSTTVNLTGPCQLAAGTPLALPYQQFPWYSVASGNALVFASTGTLNIAGRILYVQG